MTQRYFRDKKLIKTFKSELSLVSLHYALKKKATAERFGEEY